MNNAPTPSPSTRNIAGLTLIRGIVPAWVLAGALFKLAGQSPRKLPEQIVNAADSLEINLFTLLALFIALEIFAAAVMVFLNRWARPMAIFMLAVFCLVLIIEMIGGNFKSCGCLGGYSPPPWAMLAIDGGLLFGVIFLKPQPLPTSPPWAWLSAAIATLAGTIASFAILYPLGQPQPDEDQQRIAANGEENGENGTTADNGTADAAPSPGKRPLPPYWLARDVEAWVGTSYKEIDLFQYMPEWPGALDEPGVTYVVFYGRTCDHCLDMFDFDLTDPELASKTIAVEVPVSKNELRGSNPWPMPETEVTHLELPVGTDWIMTTPVTIRIEDGVVTCAQEGDHQQCMDLF